MTGKSLASPILQPGVLSTRVQDQLEPPPRRSRSPSSFPPSLSLAPDPVGADPLQESPPQNSLGLVHPTPQRGVVPAVPMDRTETAASDRSDVTLTEGEEHPNSLGQEGTPEQEVHAPQLSWFMTVFILSVVSVVRTKLAPPEKLGF